ncbi:hypothetical protein HQ529_03005 [Candidatus Woesearchaeota archaeon]|nr:hypothetical protein [Candidatus Woesearchaeota archaeon]
MKEKLVLIGAILTIILFVTGCTTGDGQTGFGFGSKSSDRFDDDTPFTAQAHQGDDGLALQFAKNNPPTKIYYTSAGTPFNVIVELRNRGAHQIDDAYLYLTGYDKNIIQDTRITPGGSLPVTFDLEPVTNFNPEGGYETVEVENTILNWPEGTDSYKPTIRASVCYRYETVANPVICIDPHPFSSLSEDKPCRVRNSYDYSGQGAPVAITGVEQEGTEDLLHLKIQVQNMQVRGVVYDEDKYNPDRGPDSSSCPFNLQYKDINKVDYDDPDFSGSGTKPQLIECKPDSPIRLVDNKATIFCKFSMPETDEIYQSPVNIRLHYGYLNYEEMSVDIMNVASE